MEDAWVDISEEVLHENAAELVEKITVAHPDLVLNMDETGLDCKRDTSKLNLVSSSPCPRV